MLLEQDVKLKLYSDLSSKAGVHAAVEGRPWLEPVKALIHAKSTPEWGNEHKGMLRCLASDGYWDRARLAESGYDVNPICECGELAALFHMVWECPKIISMR